MLLKAFIFVGCLTLSRCYYNLSGHTIFDITDMLWENIDTNKDNRTTQEEMAQYFIGVFDDNKDGITSENEFISHWSAAYDDSYMSCAHIYNRFDSDMNTILTTHDIQEITKAMDFDGDGILIHGDVLLLLHWMYGSIGTPIITP